MFFKKILKTKKQKNGVIERVIEIIRLWLFVIYSFVLICLILLKYKFLIPSVTFDN